MKRALLAGALALLALVLLAPTKGEASHGRPASGVFRELGVSSSTDWFAEDADDNYSSVNINTFYHANQWFDDYYGVFWLGDEYSDTGWLWDDDEFSEDVAWISEQWCYEAEQNEYVIELWYCSLGNADCGITYPGYTVDWTYVRHQECSEVSDPPDFPLAEDPIEIGDHNWMLFLSHS